MVSSDASPTDPGGATDGGKQLKLVLASDRLLQDTLDMNAEKVAAAIEEAHSASTAPNFYNNDMNYATLRRI